MKQLNDTTKKLAGKYDKPERPVKDKVKPIAEIQGQRNRWVGHFEEFSNRPAPFNQLNIEAAHTSFYRCQSTNDRINQDDHQTNQE
ncbi:unnamed protein product [Schistosoma margrebowiei]|uniref:Uncharacterized protein n=1 Tax=Schistosoma margrebowiei TaxID=48269 RepID=A0A183MTQ2_9TREM|nr:unnamed protein product [Schistosoma margrebowiei]